MCSTKAKNKINTWKYTKSFIQDKQNSVRKPGLQIELIIA